MKVPFVQFSDIYTDEVRDAIDRVCKNGQLILGNYGVDILELEKWFADYIGVKHAIMCGSGTQALYLAYKALGIGPSDEVITVGHTFSATFDQIVAVGATPVLVDIGEDGLMDPKEVERVVTPKTKAIVPVHLEGKVVDMGLIMPILNKAILEYKHNIFIVDDSAQAIGAKNDYQKLSNCSCYSLYPAKIFGSLGNAGMLTTNDDELAYKLSNLRANYRFEKDPSKIEYGMNFEPDNIQAAVLNVRKKYLPDYLKRREEIAKKYLEAFKDLPITLPYDQPGRVWQDFVLRIPERKADFLHFLDLNEVGYLGHDVPYYPDYPRLNLNFDLPKTKKYLEEQVRIPCNPYVTDEQVDYVIQTIRRFYNK